MTRTPTPKQSKIKRDVPAVQWAISLLEIHPGVKQNPNSQYWLQRLRDLVPLSSKRALSIKETQRLLRSEKPIKVKNKADGLSLYLNGRYAARRIKERK